MCRVSANTSGYYRRNPQISCTENRLFGDHFDVIHQSGKADSLRVTLDHFAKIHAERTTVVTPGISADKYADELFSGFCGVVIDQWQLHAGKNILVDKITPYPGTARQVAKKIRRFFPTAKIIHLARDGRDVVTSGVFHWLHRTTGDTSRSTVAETRANFYSSREASEPLRRFFDDDSLIEWASLWKQVVEAATVELSCDLTITYEQMKSDLPSTLQRIFHLLSADSSPELVRRCQRYSSFTRMSGGRDVGDDVATAHVRKGIVGDWKNYFTRADGELFAHCCGDLLLDLAYEFNSDWIQRLPSTLDLRKVA